MAQLNFDARRVQPFDHEIGANLPVSDETGHPVIIFQSEFQQTKDNRGAYLALHMKVIDGPHKGRTGVDRLNLQNPSDDARRIAEQRLSAICFVTGVLFAQTSEQLHNIPFRVLVQPQSDEKYTQIYGYMDINGNKPGAQVTAQQAQVPVQPAAPAQPQWGGNGQPGGNSQQAPQQEYASPADTPPWTQQPQQQQQPTEEAPPWQKNK